MPAWPAAAVSTLPAELTLHLLWVPSGCWRERTSKLQERPAHRGCGLVRNLGSRGLGVGALVRAVASSGAGMTGLVCAGGSELSDAMSEGERPDEASSLHPENEDHGMEPALISPAYVCCCPVKAYMPCDICLWHDFYIRPRTWIQMLSQSTSAAMHGESISACLCRGLCKASIERSNGCNSKSSGQAEAAAGARAGSRACQHWPASQQPCLQWQWDDL